MLQRTKKYISSAVAMVTCATLLLSDKVLAAGEIRAGMGNANKNGTTSNSVETTIGTITGVAMWAIGVISVITLIVAGIMYATAAGDETKVKKAKKAIVGSIIGLVFAILASVIINFVVTQI